MFVASVQNLDQDQYLDQVKDKSQDWGQELDSCVTFQTLTLVMVHYRTAQGQKPELGTKTKTRLGPGPGLRPVECCLVSLPGS